MNIADFFTFALVSVFAGNFIFSGASDVSLSLSVMRRLSRLLPVSLLVSLFSLLDTLVLYLLDRVLNIPGLDYMPVRGAVLTLIALLWYLSIGGLLRRSERTEKSIGSFIAPAAFNGAAMAAPLLLGSAGSITFAGALGLAAGTGGAFAAATWLIAAGMRRFDNPDISAGMRGAPAMLIYIGLLAMAFSALGSSL